LDSSFYNRDLLFNLTLPVQDAHVELTSSALHPIDVEQVLYTLGGNGNLALSRKHFTQAVNLNPKSTRALYGLLMVSA
jgi:hypothetical protein